MALTAKKIAKLRKPGRYPDGHGLYFQVLGPANRSWLFRYARAGRERWLGLGPLHTVTLKEARVRAKAARLQLLDGIDPLEVKRAKKATEVLAAAKTLTFAAAAEQYFDSHERQWRNAKHRAQFLSSLRSYAFPHIGRLPVGAIDTGMVLKVMDPIWPVKPVTANRVRGRIERVLDWATVRGYRSGDNPARWKGHISEALPARPKQVMHHAALPYAAIGDFMAALALREGIAARALEFLILTAARSGEVLGATWDEVNLEEKVWTVPAGRIKGGRTHRVPLSPRALAIVEALPREAGNPFVFIGPRRDGLSNMALAAVLKRMGTPVTVHGFRSTFRDWAAECTTHQNHIVEMALAHVVGDKVEAAYRRGDLYAKRARLMDDWARYCTTPLPRANVTPLRAEAVT